MASPQHRIVPPSAQAAGITASDYADALLAGREWCSAHGGYVVATAMHNGVTCNACFSARRQVAYERRRGARRRDK